MDARVLGDRLSKTLGAEEAEDAEDAETQGRISTLSRYGSCVLRGRDLPEGEALPQLLRW